MAQRKKNAELLDRSRQPLNLSSLERDFHEYLNQQDLLASTCKSYFSDVQSYVHYCADHPTASVDDSHLLNSFLNRYANKPNSKARTSASLRLFFEFLRQIGFIESDPLPRLPRGRFSVAPGDKPPLEPHLPKGPTEPQEERVVPISNLPPNSSDVPHLAHDFTIQRLRREMSRLKAEIKRLSDAKRHKDATLLKQKHLWRLGFDYAEWPTMGEAIRNLQEIESAIAHEGRMFEDELQKRGLEEKGDT